MIFLYLIFKNRSGLKLYHSTQEQIKLQIFLFLKRYKVISRKYYERV